jgi:mRNA-degrading endonuclease RelE of RelBE toxin-antitoxin system
MNKSEKFLKKLHDKERTILLGIIDAIRANKLTGLHVRKVSGYKNIYRVRYGSIRIIFETTLNGSEIIFMGYKNDTTYNNL